MPDLPDQVLTNLYKKLTELEPDSEEYSRTLKHFENYAKTQALLDSDSTPDPEPTGFKAFLRKNSGDLIKAGSTLSAILLIGVLEIKGDAIFRSKAASKFI